ncbi:MAG: hypothetical protein WAV90_02510 [Gordonia amarae]
MGALTVAGMITLTSHTEDDPYSAFWENVPDGQIGAVEKHLVESPDWQPVHLMRARTAVNLAPIGRARQMPLLYATEDATAADKAADFIEKTLGRAADSLS